VEDTAGHAGRYAGRMPCPVERLDWLPVAVKDIGGDPTSLGADCAVAVPVSVRDHPTGANETNLA
jgi:hypothetical protein